MSDRKPPILALLQHEGNRIVSLLSITEGELSSGRVCLEIDYELGIPRYCIRYSGPYTFLITDTAPVQDVQNAFLLAGNTACTTYGEIRIYEDEILFYSPGPLNQEIQSRWFRWPHEHVEAIFDGRGVVLWKK